MPDSPTLAPLPLAEVQPTMTVTEAGRYLGLSKDAAYGAVRRGELPVLQMGRRLIVPTAALRRLLLLDDSPSSPMGESVDVALAVAAAGD